MPIDLLSGREVATASAAAPKLERPCACGAKTGVYLNDSGGWVCDECAEALAAGVAVSQAADAGHVSIALI